jgi:predicted KAP-like P-loop ATPase
MDMDQGTHVEVDDRPISVKAEDRLGRSDFARMLARALVERPQASSFVVALYGGWGTGKTSTLNLAFEALNEFVGGRQDLLLVRFNPWWYSNTGELLMQFFAQLGGEFEKDDRLRSVKVSLLEYAQLLAPLGTLADLLGAGGAGSTLAGFLTALSERSQTRDQERSQDPRVLKAQIESAIKDSGRRIIVVIDDIDRLSAGEIRDVFKLVKATADFPNTRYLLAFDFDTVKEALFDVQQTDGARYLEKIVQLPFSLPEPSQGQLGDLMMDGMMQLASDQDTIEEKELSQARDSFQWYRYQGLDALIENMRQLKRVLSSLSFTLPAVAGEVRLSDFLVLEMLRVLFPESYNKLLAKQGLLVGFPQYTNVKRAEQAKVAIREAVEDISSAVSRDTEGVVPKVLEAMFPKV